MFRCFCGPARGRSLAASGGKVAEVPVFDELAKSGNSRVLLQGTQCCDTEAVCILKFDNLSVGRLLEIQSQKIFYLIIKKENSLLACPCHTPAVLEVKKGKWPPSTLTLSSLPESFLRDKRSSAFFVDR